MNGREYFVAPMTTIVPGVLSGSQGALYYPPEEIAKNVSAWDNVPITLYHPTHNGMPVSAQHPGIIDKYGLGFLAKSTFNGKLQHEGWFDIERCQKVDNRVYMALLNNQPMELSTGLGTDNEIQNGKCPAGRPYYAIARNYRPDHLAVLPDQTGACSQRDGCGVLINGFCPTGPGGGQDNSCGRGKGGGEKASIGSKDKKGRIVISDAVAKEGHDLAEEGLVIDRRYDRANERHVNLQYSKLKRDKKALPAAREEYDAAVKELRAHQEKSIAFEKKHGLNVVDAHQAHTGKPWQHYKVRPASYDLEHISESNAVQNAGVWTWLKGVVSNALGRGNHGIAKMAAHADELATLAEAEGTPEAYKAASEAFAACAEEAANPVATAGEKDYTASGQYKNRAAELAKKAESCTCGGTCGKCATTNFKLKGTTNMTKQEKIAVLTANAELKGANFENFSDAQLDHLLKLNAMPAALAKAKEDALLKEEEELEEEEEVVKNKSIRERLNDEELAVWNCAERIANDHKAALIRKLTANVKDKTQREEKARALNAYKIPQLEDFVSLLPAATPVANSEQPAPLFLGLGFEQQPVANRRQDFNPSEDLLDLPTTNWSK